jgi:hypothetical protein
VADQPDIEKLNEAEHYKLEATFILNALQANLQVYNSNSAWSGAQPADVVLALRYIDRSLEHFPDNPAYLNLKALLLIEGGVDRTKGMQLLERAAELSPRDITILNNLEKLKAAEASACFIATAAYGSAQAWQVDAFRDWRDECLVHSRPGRAFIRLYYAVSPPLARIVSASRTLRSIARWMLDPVASAIRARRAR